jgi:phosphohistidine phosphatase SixA
MIYWLHPAQGESHPGDDLTTIGYNQAHKAGLWLRERGVNQVLASTHSFALRTAEIVTNVLKVPVQIEPKLDILTRPASQETLFDLANLLAEVEDPMLIISPGDSMVELLPRLCVNAAALQRVQLPHPAGFIVLERYDLSRYICHSWDLREHLT